MKSGNLNFLEPSRPLQACNGTDLPLPLARCGWVVKATPRPALFPGKIRYPLYRGLGGAPGPERTDAEILAPTGIRSPAHMYVLSESNPKYSAVQPILNVVMDSAVIFRRVLKISRSDFVMSVRPSVRLSECKNSATIGRIFMKFDIFVFLEILSKNFKFIKI